MATMVSLSDLSRLRFEGSRFSGPGPPDPFLSTEKTIKMSIEASLSLRETRALATALFCARREIGMEFRILNRVT